MPDKMGGQRHIAVQSRQSSTSGVLPKWGSAHNPSMGRVSRKTVRWSTPAARPHSPRRAFWPAAKSQEFGRQDHLTKWRVLAHRCVGQARWRGKSPARGRCPPATPGPDHSRRHRWRRDPRRALVEVTRDTGLTIRAERVPGLVEARPRVRRFRRSCACDWYSEPPWWHSTPSRRNRYHRPREYLFL